MTWRWFFHSTGLADPPRLGTEVVMQTWRRKNDSWFAVSATWKPRRRAGSGNVWWSCDRWRSSLAFCPFCLVCWSSSLCWWPSKCFSSIYLGFCFGLDFIFLKRVSICWWLSKRFFSIYLGFCLTEFHQGRVQRVPLHYLSWPKYTCHERPSADNEGCASPVFIWDFVWISLRKSISLLMTISASSVFFLNFVWQNFSNKE